MTMTDWGKRYEDSDAPLYQVVYRTLHYAIISGQVRPGEHLPEISLSHQLKVSRTPVRMALLELEKEGMVERRSGRTIVKDDLDRELRELLETREALESVAVASACRNATEDDILLLERINEEFAQALRAGNAAGGARADERFHEAVYRIADNRVLLRTLHGLESSIYGYRVKACRDNRDAEQQIRGHRRIISALKKKSEPLARRALLDHLAGQQYVNVEDAPEAKGA